MITFNQYLDIKPEVQEALDKKLPIVALESTIISHGMPYPQNVEMAKKVESIIRAEGAVPATIAIMNGKIKIGLSDEDLETLANADYVAKVSRRDVAKIVANKTIGNVVCYDSDIPHEVTEVTEGTRISGLIVLNVKDFELATAVMKTKKGVQCIITNSRHCSFGYDQRIELFEQVDYCYLKFAM